MVAATLAQPKINPHEGPQAKFFCSPADIAIYGGAAGGGKTWAMLAEPLRHVGNPKFGAVIFRKSYPQITGEGGLWDEACQLYPLFGARMLTGDMLARFPSGAKVSFRHMEHEQTKLEWQGTQIPLIEFDELTHFSESQFFYMLSRNRSLCGVRPYVRASCNPDARSWVAKLIAWWIDQDTGFPIPERAGKVRWFVRHGDGLSWGDSRKEMEQRHPGQEPKSLAFFPSKLEDNPTLLKKDPGYLANLMALPRLEREQLLGGNWLATEETVIDKAHLRSYTLRGEIYSVLLHGEHLVIDSHQCRRLATIDTAGTSKEKAEDKKGKPPSWSVLAVWDYWHAKDLLFLRHVWRDRVGWNELKSRIPEVLKGWGVPRAYIENAHHGPALKDELRGVQCELIGPVLPGMTDSSRGAKLERAVASRLLSRIEDGLLRLPEEADWKAEYVNELTTWSGLPDETADQIDVSSYASFVCRRALAPWGGVVVNRGIRR